VGKREAVGLVLLGILASGHILIEDLPGLGKTLLARSFARVLGLQFTRVQFTPDMLPADLTGAVVLDPGTGGAVFRRGPVFTNLLLADEINRTPPKTQAALLEAMAEAQVSADGHTHPLAQPFVVLATDNPIEYEGTYPLPEAQLDRFIARVRLGYLDHAGEAEMARRRLARGSAPPQPAQVTDAAGLLAMRESLERVHLDAGLLGYIVSLVAATRTHPQASVGASPRGTLAVVQLARGSAVLESRDYVTPEDVKAVAVPALAHRLVLRPEMWVRQVTGEDVIGEILETVPVPRTG
jgi:MoxR-like ATPase